MTVLEALARLFLHGGVLEPGEHARVVDAFQGAAERGEDASLTDVTLLAERPRQALARVFAPAELRELGATLTRLGSELCQLAIDGSAPPIS